ncbi:MAG: enoyl-CoA hydratase/isomerase family protein [Acidobacteria bacterium]|nr:enoyl-CoA hydratase/isomerase family protein [Acidobacteriota bacterium]
MEREELDEGVTLLRLNRPERLNAITPPLMAALQDRLHEVRADRGCRVVVLTGAGRGFCAGADLKGGDPDEPDPFEVRPGPVGTFQLQELFSESILALRRMGKPVIAAVNGPAVGGGLTFVLGSDIRIAAESARFSAAFVRIGLTGSDMGTSWLLNRVVGAGQAHELMLTGRIIDAQEALRIGLVVEVVPDSELLDAARAKAALIVRNSPFGVYLTKQTMWASLEVPGLEAAVHFDNRSQVLTTTTADNREAGAAFREGRDPQFTDS